MRHIEESGDWQIGVAGDWHGNTVWARHALATFGMRGITNVFQVGDFGIGWPGGNGRHFLDLVEGACTRWQINLFIIPGNHENWDVIDALPVDDDGMQPLGDSGRIWVLPRGFRGQLMDKSMVALGGAPSIDFQHRMEGRSWWRNEMITLEDVDKVAADGPADIMFAHDAPDGGTDAVQRIIDTPPHLSGWSDSALRYAKEGRELMNMAVDAVKPKLFVHGHYHVADEAQKGDTTYLSLHMDGMHKNIAVIDLETLDHEWLDIVREIPK